MKNLEIRKENINKIKKGFSVAALSLITAISFSTKASAHEVTAQDIVNTMINGDPITTELEPQELDELIDEAEVAIIKAGSSLLPKELDEIYSRIETKKEQENDKEKVAILCDYFLYDGTASAMTYPESLQFERVCEVTCGSLMDEGKTSIYSIYQSNMLGEDVYTELDVIIEQAEKNRDIKEGNVRISPPIETEGLSYFFRVAISSLKLSIADCRFSMISIARTSGSGKLSRSAKDLSLIQKISKLVLSRLRISSTSNLRQRPSGLSSDHILSMKSAGMNVAYGLEYGPQKSSASGLGYQSM